MIMSESAALNKKSHYFAYFSGGAGFNVGG